MPGGAKALPNGSTSPKPAPCSPVIISLIYPPISASTICACRKRARRRRTWPGSTASTAFVIITTGSMAAASSSGRSTKSSPAASPISPSVFPGPTKIGLAPGMAWTTRCYLPRPTVKKTTARISDGCALPFAMSATSASKASRSFSFTAPLPCPTRAALPPFGARKLRSSR